MTVKQILRLFQTIRYLRLSQVSYRVYYLLRNYSAKRLIAISLSLKDWKRPWESPCAFQSTLNFSGQITFLGESGSINNDLAWNDSARSKLWLYNLHYFDVLNTSGTDQQSVILDELIMRWIQNNPPLIGNGWEPYPLSLRLVNWIKWFSRQEKSVSFDCLSSLNMQAEALLNQIEYHILGNHLFANGKALIFAGAFFNGSRANIWLKKGLEILDREIKEQFLADGAHFELSPMYHATLLWDLCDLVNLSQCSGLQELSVRENEWGTCILRGLSWLKSMTHPDKKISFFNDATFGIAPEYTVIEQYARQLGFDTVTQTEDEFLLNWLPDSGYCVANLGSGCKAIIDLARIGPDYQPGHAHADSLSFELSICHQRVLVNSGISQYGDDQQRHYERSTQAHNTVTLDGQSSSDVWAGFRVGHRAYPRNVIVNAQEHSFFIAASHDGYRRLPGRNIHRREWQCTENKLTITDRITGPYQEAIARLYFHPAIRPELGAGGVVTCRLPDEKEVLIRVGHHEKLTIENTFWYPQFGVKQDNFCLVMHFNSDKLITEITW